jgi:hypothetical protein
MQIYDKNEKLLKENETVQYCLRKEDSGEEVKGFVRVLRVSDDGELYVRLWDNIHQCFSQAEMTWEVEEYKGGIRAYVKKDGDEIWLESVEEAIPFDAPLSVWPKVLSQMTAQFVLDEGVSFALNGRPLSIEEVSDPNGFLSLFLFMGEEKKRIVFPDSKSSFRLYTNPDSLLDLSFVYEETGDRSHNTLYHMAHFLADVLFEVKDKLRAFPEKAVNGMYELESDVLAMYAKTKKKEYIVLPYRPEDTENKKKKPTFGQK